MDNNTQPQAEVDILQVCDAGTLAIDAERTEQILKHNYTTEYDVQHNHFNQLAMGASFLASLDEAQFENTHEMDACILNHTPFNWNVDIWYKMCTKPKLQRIILAGALLAAEVSRLKHIYGGK